MFFYFLKTKLRYPIKVVKKREWTKLLVVLLFSLLAFGVMVGVYALFQRWFGFLQAQEYFGSALTFYVLGAFFLVVSLLLFSSALIATIVFFFHSRELQFLFSAPLSKKLVFKLRLFFTFVSSFWPLAVLGLPALLALTLNLEVGITGFLFYLLGLFLFGVVVVGAGTAFALAWKKFIAQRSLYFRVALALAILVVFLGGSYVTIFPEDFQEYFSITNLEESALSARETLRRFRFWPASHFLVNFFFAYTEGGGGLQLGALLGLTFLVGGLLSYLQKDYHKVWQQEQEKNFVAGKSAKTKKEANFLASKPFWFLVEKEIRLFKRRFNELSRALFLFLLLLFYLSAISYLARRLSLSRIERFRPILTSVNLAILGYFIITLTLRYVFPSFSREGSSINYLLSSVQDRVRIFMAKFLFWFTIIALPMVLMSFFSFLAMGYGGRVLVSALFYILLVVATFVFLSLQLGAYFADFKAESADQFTTTPAGLSLTIIGLSYVLLGAFIFQKTLTGLSFSYFGAYLLVTFFGLSLMLAVLPQSLRKLGT